MTKEFVPYEQALELKQLGFDEPCLGYWNIDPYLPKPTFNLVIPFEHEWCVPAPLKQQAFRWFREKYGLYSHVRESYSFDNTLEFVSQINGSYVNHGIFDKPINRFDTYEEAELACLTKLIEIVKNK